MLARLHECLQAVHKGAALDSFVREVLELVQDDLAMHDDETLHSGDLRHTTCSRKCLQHTISIQQCQHMHILHQARGLLMISGMLSAPTDMSLFLGKQVNAAIAMYASCIQVTSPHSKTYRADYAEQVL